MSNVIFWQEGTTSAVVEKGEAQSAHPSYGNQTLRGQEDVKKLNFPGVSDL
jgi:hypothetical protein